MQRALVKKFLLSTVVSAGWLSPTTGALAQDTPLPDDASAPESGVEEIVVTAQKRSEAANKVGVSINAYTGSTLRTRGVLDTADLAKIVPGFTFVPSQYNAPVYSIRGIGFYETTLSATPAVTVYTDEIPLPYPAMTKAAGLDLARVEVLKGPQGTLFGQNSTGGAVNYIAAKPTEDFEAGLSLSYGSYDFYDAEGYVSGPIDDTLRYRVAVRANGNGDWQKSYTRDDENGEQNQLQGRLLLDWTPTEDLTLTLNVNGFLDKGDTQAPSLTAITLQKDIPNVFDTYPLAPERNRAADWTPGLPSRDDRFYQAALRADYKFDDAFTLTSITAYESFDTQAGNEFDAMRYEVIDVWTDGRITSFNQELRLAGDWEKVSFIVGANYQSDKVEDNQLLGLGDSTQTPTIPGVTPPWRFTSNFTDQDVETLAVFANVNYEIADDVKLIAAVRYTDVSRDFEGCTTADRGLSDSFEILQSIFNNAIFGVPSFVPIPTGSCLTLSPVGTSPETSFLPTLVTAKLDEENVSWKAGVEWQLEPTLLLYGNVSKGYKSGSFPTLSGGTTAQYAPVTQESVLAYEVGFKATLFERAAQLNAAAFYYDYKDKQFRGKFLDPIFGVIDGLTNVPKSNVWGIEANLQAEPVEGLTLSVGGTYLQSEIEDYVGIGATGLLDDFSGNAFPYTPKLQLQGDVQYEHTIGEGNLTAFVGASVVYNASTNSSLGDEPLTDIKPYALIDLRAGIASADGQWRLTAWGRNVTDKFYWTNSLRGGDTAFRYYGKPATYGVTLSYAL